MDKDKSEAAERLLLNAIQLDDITLDYLGMISHYANLAILCLKQDLQYRATEYMNQV